MYIDHLVIVVVVVVTMVIACGEIEYDDCPLYYRKDSGMDVVDGGDDVHMQVMLVMLQVGDVVDWYPLHHVDPSFSSRVLSAQSSCGVALGTVMVGDLALIDPMTHLVESASVKSLAGQYH